MPAPNASAIPFSGPEPVLEQPLSSFEDLAVPVLPEEVVPEVPEVPPLGGVPEVPPEGGVPDVPDDEGGGPASGTGQVAPGPPTSMSPRVSPLAFFVVWMLT